MIPILTSEMVSAEGNNAYLVVEFTCVTPFAAAVIGRAMSTVGERHSWAETVLTLIGAQPKETEGGVNDNVREE